MYTDIITDNYKYIKKMIIKLFICYFIYEINLLYTCIIKHLYFLIIADQLMGMLNSALNVSETETIYALHGTSTLSSPACEATSCPSPRSCHSHSQQSIMGMIQPICHYLTSQVSQLSQLLVNMIFYNNLITALFLFYSYFI